MKNLLLATVLFATLFNTQTSVASQASQDSLAASLLGASQIVEGSVDIIQAGSEFVITGVEFSGEVAYVGLKASGNAAVATSEFVIEVSSDMLRASAKAAHEVSEFVSDSAEFSVRAGKTSLVAAGDIVSAVATSTGHILVASGYAIAFIPNELGKALIHRSRR